MTVKLLDTRRHAHVTEEYRAVCHDSPGTSLRTPLLSYSTHHVHACLSCYDDTTARQAAQSCKMCLSQVCNCKLQWDRTRVHTEFNSTDTQQLRWTGHVWASSDVRMMSVFMRSDAVYWSAVCCSVSGSHLVAFACVPRPSTISVSFLNVPIGIVAFIVATRTVRESDPAKRGSSTSPAWSWEPAPLLPDLRTDRGQPEGLERPVIVAGLVGGALLAIAFLVWESTARTP